MMSGGGEEQDGISLTNLDQPVFDSAGATKRDLVDYLDAVADRIIPELRERPLSVIRVPEARHRSCRRTCPRTPRPGSGPSRSGPRPRTGGGLRPVQRPPHAAVVRQPARRRVPPNAGPRRSLGPPDAPRARHRPAGRRHVLSGRPGGAAGAAGADRRRAGRRGEDEWCQGRARVRAGRRAGAVEDVAAATRALAARAERLDPELATTAFIREDRGGKVFLDSTRAGGATVVAAYSPRVRPGMPVSFPVPWDELDRVTPADFTVRTAARSSARRTHGRQDATAAAFRRRADRGGARDPGRQGAGDARGQAACPRPPRLTAWRGHLAALVLSDA